MSLKKSILLFLLFFIPLEFVVFSLTQRKDLPGMVRIPGGEFMMGSDEVDREGNQAEMGNRKPWYLDEHPQRRLFLPAFFIDQDEVTNLEYLEFLQKRQRRPPPSWKEERFPEGQANFPVVDVNWYEVQAYCQWRGKRLPTEAEWEKAARGPSGNVFVWGNRFDPKKGNVSAGGHGGVTLVGSWKEDKSPYGVFDMNGNVMEWVADWYQAYPGGDFQSPNFGERFKVAKGDAFGEAGHYALPIFSRLAYRQDVEPTARYPFLGFRCAK